ncbi:MAG: Calx-beta domain-containing protein, partial [Cyanobacteria bacterium P01_G01_bin.19]
ESVFGHGGYDGAASETNIREVSDFVKASYRQIFEHLNTFVDREFVEVAESESTVGNIRILVSDAPSYAYAYYGGNIHLGDWAAASDAGHNGWESIPGVYAYAALLHELGHSLGMPHTFGRDSSVFDPEDNSSNSVMSYTFPGYHPGTFMAYDIKSLQERYGADEYRPEDTVYEFLTVDNYLVDGDLSIDTSSKLKQTIWDSGGTDTFDFSNLAFDDSGYRFNLNQAEFQTTQNAYQGSSYTKNNVKYYVPKYGTSIAIDVEIENIINSSSDDIIIGNPIGNMFGGYSPELTTGSDRLIDTNSLDTLDLSTFAFSELNLVQINQDLEIDLGDANFVTVEGYYSLAEDARINILYKPEDTAIAVTPPVVSLEDITVYEEDTNSTAKVTISLDKAVRDEFTVSYSTLDNSAIAGEDYQAVSGTVTFNPGEMRKTVQIPIIGDALNESNESFYLTTGYGNAEIIIDDDDSDTLPQISIQDAGVLSSIPVRDSNGNIKNTTGLLFKITLDTPSNQTVKVDYATADGSAVEGEDYSAKSTTLTFQPGETEKQVYVGITVDDTEEADENLYLNLSNPVNAAIADNQAVGTIEETRSLSVSDVAVSEDGTEAVFTISLDKPSVHTAIASFSTEDGTAKAGEDYTYVSGRFGILPGESSITVRVPLIDNSITELDETFFLNLTTPKHVLIDDAQGQATIINDDAIPTENPGGIYQNLQLWLKADSDVTTSNGQVVVWGDNSQAEIDLGQDNADSRPTLEANGLNYNPVISFDGSNDTLASLNTLPTDFANEDVSIYIVSQSDRTNQRSSILAATPDSTYRRLLVHLPYSGNVYFDQGTTYSGGRLSTSFDTANTFQMWNFQTETEVGQSILLNGLEIASDSDTSNRFNADGKTLELSSLISADAFEGDIAEVIIFNQALAAGARLAVDSYLGIKYGFTLDQTTPTNYINSQGEILWDATAAGNYNQDIAGIVIDNASDLNQIKSRSSNDDGIVTIGNASDLDNGEALTWSNNGGVIDAYNTIDLGNYEKMPRQWYLQQKGNIGTVDLSFDLSNLGYETTNPDDFVLLLDDDGDFSNAVSSSIPGAINGDKITFAGVDLNDTNYFSLALPVTGTPGDVSSNLQVWLKAGSGVTTDNGKVSNWQDSSLNQRNYSQSAIAKQPVVTENAINFNPAVTFDGLWHSGSDGDLLVTDKEIYTEGSLFFVVNSNKNSGSLLADDWYLNYFDLNYGIGGKVGVNYYGGDAYASDLDSPVDEIAIVSFDKVSNSSIFNLAVEKDGVLLDDSVDTENSNHGFVNRRLAPSFEGDIAEFILYDSVLDAVEETKVRTYLGIKYGITLDRTTPTNYIASDGSILWDAAIAGEYKHDIGGIARDDHSDLLQIKSRSSNADSIITIAAEDTVNGLEDGEALIWGNNNSAELSQRIWQVQENQGDLGTVSISLDLLKLGEQLPLEEYALQISDSDNFSNFQFHTFGRTISDSTLTFKGVDFNHGQYFTLNTEYSSHVNILDGTENDDVLIGNAEDQIINGYGGDDRLRGGKGNDTIDGGLGQDRLTETSSGNLLLTDIRLITDDAGTDYLSNLETVALRGLDDNNSIDASGVNSMKAVFSSYGGDDTLKGGQLNDVLKGGHGNDFLEGNGGNDILVGNAGNDTIDGGLGSDRFIATNTGDLLLAQDRLIADNGETDFFSHIESIVLWGKSDNNLIDGKASSLKLILDGRDGNDTLIGGTGDDVLKGGNGDDLLSAGDGNNVLFGNDGADTFVLESGSGKVTVKDFSQNVDKLGLSGNLNFNDLIVKNNQFGTASIVIDSSNNNNVLAILIDVDANDLTSDDFVVI